MNVKPDSNEYVSKNPLRFYLVKAIFKHPALSGFTVTYARVFHD
ncbi:hypothetical protein D1BOALGB6SA_119 [Olavius sp. associated proteobacterium Delta 1]|nr:hypothetical protein D1BOALGB6SA_119 [Olavius sp. associated proteobacterium Delta 1]